MKFKEYLIESRRDIILVDFQPAYSTSYGYKDAFTSAINELNKNNFGKALIFFNGEDLGLDSKQDVINHYVEYGLNEDIVHRLSFRDKGYGFLRDWMDTKVDESIIIKTIRYLLLNKLSDARDITDKKFINYLVNNDINVEDLLLYLPDVSISELKSLSGARIGGGSKCACLREIELLMNALNIRYKEVRDWIYE